MVRPIDVVGFEQLFSADPDPWNYKTSRFEEHKRTMLLHHCRRRALGRVLELGCAIGVTTQFLAQGALRVVAVDASPSALALAERHLSDKSNVRFIEGRLPHDLPRGPYDTIVVSELVYYLSARDAVALARGVVDVCAPGARVVVLHHHLKFPDAAVQPELAHRRFVSHLRRRLVPGAHSRTNRFMIDVLHRARP